MNKLVNTFKSLLLGSVDDGNREVLKNVAFIVDLVDDSIGLKRRDIMNKLYYIFVEMGFTTYIDQRRGSQVLSKAIRLITNYNKENEWNRINCCVFIVVSAESYWRPYGSCMKDFQRIIDTVRSHLTAERKIFVFQHEFHLDHYDVRKNRGILDATEEDIEGTENQRKVPHLFESVELDRNTLLAYSSADPQAIDYCFRWYLEEFYEGIKKYYKTYDVATIIKIVNDNTNQRYTHAQRASCLVNDFTEFYFSGFPAQIDGTIGTGIVPVYESSSRLTAESLIINNIQFMDNKKYRRGAVIDGENIRELFEEIGFNVRSKDNLTATTMRLELQNFSKSLRQVDICVVVIMSHGTNRSVLGGYTEILGFDDDNVSVEEVLSYFSNEACPSLKDKPKIFIFQCCRGTNTHFVEEDSIRPPLTIHADMLIAYSTLPGFTSRRDPLKGTWYIQTICEVFKKHARELDIESLLKIVDNEMEKHDKTVRQVTHYESRGFKRRCYLPIYSISKQ